MAARAGARQLVEGSTFVAGRVFDGQTRDARLDAEPNVLCDTLRRMRVARLEVGIDRQVGGGHDLNDVSQHHVACHGTGIRQTTRESEPGAGRGQSFES
jgi:hypothetical protein